MSTRIQGVQEKEYKGVKYKSILEADTAEALDLMGFPIRYEEKAFTIFEGFKCPFQKRKVLDTHYIPDFWVGDIMLECKGFETPEWKLKKKLIFKYLMDKEPGAIFYQINKHSWKKDLIQALDNHWSYLGYAIQVTSKGTKRKPSEIKLYDSVKEAMQDLNLHGNMTPILMSLLGKREWVYNYNWKLIKINL
jgi:hypothetical protein